MKRAAGALAAVPVALAGVSWHTLVGMTLAVLIFTAPCIGPSLTVAAPGGSPC